MRGMKSKNQVQQVMNAMLTSTFSIDEASDVLQVSKATVYSRIRSGHLHPVFRKKPGRFATMHIPGWSIVLFQLGIKAETLRGAVETHGRAQTKNVPKLGERVCDKCNGYGTIVVGVADERELWMKGQRTKSNELPPKETPENPENDQRFTPVARALPQA